jgi:deazaflavin-dependent oxidoreductase (nitroreductase family)
MNVIDDLNTHVIQEFRSNGGVVGGDFEDLPLLLLVSLGAKSGLARTHPVVYRETPTGWAIFASASGAERNPSWYYNLKAEPRALVEIGTERIAVRARECEGQEREQVWDAHKARYPDFARLERRTSRRIPVLMLEPA